MASTPEQINDKLEEMEGRLQQIIDLTESIKLRSTELSKTKDERKTERVDKMDDENLRVAPEIRFKRFLYYGEQKPLYQPWDRLSSDKFDIYRVPSITIMLNQAAKQLYLAEPEKDEDGKDKNEKIDPKKKETFKILDPNEVPVLSMVLQALKDSDHPYPECAIFILACIARHPAGGLSVQSAAYKMACEFIITADQFFLFIKFVNAFGQRMSKTKKCGWGNGMKKFVKQWYLKQNEVELARSVCHRASYYNWTHKDVFKLAHFKTSDKSPGMQALACYIVKGIDEAEKLFGSNTEAAAVMEEFRKRKLELSADSDALVKLIDTHKLKPQDLPSSKLHQGPIWCALLKNMNSREVLDYLPSILKLRIAGAEDVRKAAAAVLTKEGQGAHVTPTQVYVTQKNYCMALANKGHKFNSAYLNDKRKLETFIIRDPCPIIMQALHSLLAASFKAIDAGGIRMVLALDLRAWPALEASNLHYCSWTHSLHPMQAMAVTALSLARSNKRFTLTTFVEGQEMQIISVPKSATIDTMIDKFKELQATAAKEPSLVEPMNWAKERKRDLDLFIVMTPMLQGWAFKGHDIGKTLQQYRDAIKKPDARLAVWAVSNMCVRIANPRNLGMMDFAGFSCKSIQVINSLCQGKF